MIGEQFGGNFFLGKSALSSSVKRESAKSSRVVPRVWPWLFGHPDPPPSSGLVFYLIRRLEWQSHVRAFFITMVQFKIASSKSNKYNKPIEPL